MFMEKADTDLYERQGSGVFNEDKAKNYSAQIVIISIIYSKKHNIKRIVIIVLFNCEFILIL
jgi:hypothetical protein